jgi:MinD-like ATPase involved in chromosome partitioning or flagellar assembly
MSKITPKAIFIGREDIGNAISSLRPEWDFLPPVDSIESLWSGLADGSIDNNVQVLFILDTFFDPSGTNTSFEKVVSTMSPWCFFGIIKYRENQESAIRERIDSEAYMNGAGDDPLFFFIDPTKPNETIDTALNQFIRQSKASDAIKVLTGRDMAEPQPTEVAIESSSKSSLGPVKEDSPYLGQIVAITSSKGGSGKSTISLSLGTYLAHASEASVDKKIEKRRLKIIVVDIDIRDGQLGFLTGYSKPTIINMRLNGINEETLEKTIITSKRLKVDLLLAPKRPRNSEDTPPDFYIELLQFLRERYDYVLLDTSVNYLDPLLEKVAYPTADQIVFITDIVVNSVFSMTRWINEVTNDHNKEGMGINRNKIGVVVNKALAEVNMSSEKIQRGAMGLPIISVIPSNPKLAAHAANLQSMELLLKHQEIRASIRRLAKAVVGKKYQLSDDF